MSAEPILVAPQLIENIWSLLIDGVKDCCEYSDGTMTPDSLLKDLVKGHKQLWVIGDRQIELFVITEVVTYPASKTLLLSGAYGKDFKKHREALESAIVGFAHKYGCDQLMLCGRRGWAKIFPQAKLSRIVMTQTLTLGA